MSKVLVMVLVLCVPASSAWAGDAVEKLGRGVSNIISAPLELPKTMGEIKEEKGYIAGLTWGTFAGTVEMLKRLFTGVFEVATFPLPIPANYAPIKTDPEYFLDGKDPRADSR